MRLAKEGGWVIVGQLATVIGSLVLIRVITGYLEPTEYGLLALGLTVAGLVSQVISGGILSSISRFYSIAAAEDDLTGYLIASWRLLGYASVGVVGVTILLISGLSILGYSQWISLVAAIMMFSIIGSYNAGFNNLQNAARHRALSALHGGLESWLKVLLAFVVILYIGSSSIAIVLGFSLASLLVIGSHFFFFRHQFRFYNGQKGKYKNWQLKMWKYSWPIMVGGIFNWASFASQSWALELFTTTDNVGKFYALMQIGYTPISLGGGLILGFITPILFSKAGNLEHHDRVQNISQIVFKISIFGLSLTFVLSAISFFMHDKVFELFVAPKYRDVSIYMPLVILAAGLLQVSASLASIISVKNKTQLFLPLSLVGNSFIAFLNMYATYRWGLTGLAFSMVIGHSIHLTWMVVLVLKN